MCLPEKPEERKHKQLQFVLLYWRGPHHSILQLRSYRDGE